MDEIEVKAKHIKANSAESVVQSGKDNDSINDNAEAFVVNKDIDYSCLGSYLKQFNSVDTSECHTNVIVGEELLKLYEKVSSFNKRNSYSYLLDYIKNEHASRVCILYGLRRTGKTTLLFQLIKDLDISKTAYIKIQESDSMGDLIKDINILKKQGIEYYLIDEITLLSDFINSAAVLSDIYCAMGYKIILSGTDSLGFDFARRDELYDRAVTIHTSYITFKEFSEVLGKNDIDDYIEYGGTLQKENMSYDDPDYKKEDVSFRDDESTRKYIDSAISHNIQRTLRNERFGSRFYHLKELYDKNELTNAINRIVENMNHEFLLSVIKETFKSHDLGFAKQLLAHNKDENIQTALYEIDQKAVIDTLKRLIDIKEKEETTVEITQQSVDQIKEYLYVLDLIKDVEIRYSDGIIEKRPVFTQPGMRYSIAKALCYSLLQDNYFKMVSEKNKEIILNKILQDVKGRMLEDIVLLESTYKKNRNEEVFKYIDNQKNIEYNMVKYNKHTNKFVVYEIKHSSKVDLNAQAKHLKNVEALKEMAKKFGILESKKVLYKGICREVGEIYYLTVETYLKNLK